MSSCSLITVTGSLCSFLQLGKNIRRSSRKSYLSQTIQTKRLWMMNVISDLFCFIYKYGKNGNVTSGENFFSKKCLGRVTFLKNGYL